MLADDKKNKSRIAGVNPEDIPVFRTFQADICRSDKERCPYWNNGCTHTKACRKWHDYLQRSKKKNPVQLQKHNTAPPKISAFVVKERIEEAIEFLENLKELQLPALKSKTIKMQAIINRLKTAIE